MRSLVQSNRQLVRYEVWSTGSRWGVKDQQAAGEESSWIQQAAGEEWSGIQQAAGKVWSAIHGQSVKAQVLSTGSRWWSLTNKQPVVSSTGSRWWSVIKIWYPSSLSFNSTQLNHVLILHVCAFYWMCKVSLYTACCCSRILLMLWTVSLLMNYLQSCLFR